MKTLKVSFRIGRHVKRDGFACRDEGRSAKPLGSRMVMYARLASLWGRNSPFEAREAERWVEGLFESLLSDTFQ